MKKFLAFALLILTVIPVHAQDRGALTNTYASWFSVAAGEHKTITLPANSRDLYIQNGSAVAICVSPKGETLTAPGTAVLGACRTTTDSYAIQMAAGTDMYLSDYITNSITFRAVSTVASPVSVVVTY